MAVDRQPGGDPVTGAPRWYLRLRGDEKEFVTVWLTLRQRTLHHETQFMPGPETNVEATWEYLLKKNADLLGMCFALGPEEAVYLVGRVPVERVDEAELDRIMGASLATRTSASRRPCPSATRAGTGAGPRPNGCRRAEAGGPSRADVGGSDAGERSRRPRSVRW